MNLHRRPEAIDAALAICGCSHCLNTVRQSMALMREFESTTEHLQRLRAPRSRSEEQAIWDAAFGIAKAAIRDQELGATAGVKTSRPPIEPRRSGPAVEESVVQVERLLCGLPGMTQRLWVDPLLHHEVNALARVVVAGMGHLVDASVEREKETALRVEAAERAVAPPTFLSADSFAKSHPLKPAHVVVPVREGDRFTQPPPDSQVGER